MVADEQIQRVVSRHEIPIQQRAETLVQAANDNGGADNITVELVEFALSAQDINPGIRMKKRWKKARPYARPAVLLLAVGVIGLIIGLIVRGDSPSGTVKPEATTTQTSDSQPDTLAKSTRMQEPPDTCTKVLEDIYPLGKDELPITVFESGGSVVIEAKAIGESQGFIKVSTTNSNRIKVSLKKDGFTKKT